MGNGLELVQSIETINGKVPKARGDLQFRMYVLLKPDALQKLKDSSEFFRDRDNTVYHRGYPMNYRQDGGAPSIQVSIAKDGRHADIDVDYRTSKFPTALFNGHLTAANSDVRAGNNTQKHVQRWYGLTDWWHNLFGLADPDEETVTVSESAAGEVPPVPRKGAGKLDDAVADYLNSWLVEQKPELSAAYLSPRSFACLEEYGPQAGREINAGIAPYLAARDMAATNRLVGKPANLQGAVKPAALARSQSEADEAELCDGVRALSGDGWGRGGFRVRSGARVRGLRQIANLRIENEIRPLFCLGVSVEAGARHGRHGHAFVDQRTVITGRLFRGMLSLRTGNQTPLPT